MAVWFSIYINKCGFYPNECLYTFTSVFFKLASITITLMTVKITSSHIHIFISCQSMVFTLLSVNFQSIFECENYTRFFTVWDEMKVTLLLIIFSLILKNSQSTKKNFPICTSNIIDLCIL
jgi:hypothetical protein